MSLHLARNTVAFQIQFFFYKKMFCNNVHATMSRGGGGGGQATPLYKPYRYTAPKGMVFEPFWTEIG